jgi:hypothetical protein
MIWTCSLGIHTQFGGETWKATTWKTKEITDNDMVQETIFGKLYIHSITNPLFQYRKFSIILSCTWTGKMPVFNIKLTH